MSLFDDALLARFVNSPEIAAINVTSTDTLLIHDSATGTIMRMPVSILYSALGSAFASLIDGKVPASQLPSYVDDVLEYANVAAFSATGETGKIYVAIDTNKTYRWSGSAYVEISASLALGETSSTAYRGDRGKTAYDHSQATGNPHGTTKSDVGLSNVDNTSDANKPVSTAQAAALALKADKALEAWISPSLLNGWENYGSGYQDAGFLKDNFGIVRLKGLVKNGSINSVIFTLPAGYRPEASMVLLVNANGGPCYMEIHSSGSVYFTNASTAFVSLDNISFKAA